MVKLVFGHGGDFWVGSWLWEANRHFLSRLWVAIPCLAAHFHSPWSDGPFEVEKRRFLNEVSRPARMAFEALCGAAVIVPVDVAEFSLSLLGAQGSEWK